MIFLVSMIFSKAIEIKTGNAHFMSTLFQRFDGNVHVYSDLLFSKFKRYRKISNLLFFEFIPSFSFEILTRMNDFVSKKYHTAGNNFRGKKALRHDGSVSFFLSRLSEEKINSSESRI